MNKQAVLLTVLSSVLTVLVADLTGYARARQQYLVDLATYSQSPIGSPPTKPTWDWPLFGIRFLTAVVGGLTSAGLVSVSLPGQ